MLDPNPIIGTQRNVAFTFTFSLTSSFTFTFSFTLPFTFKFTFSFTTTKYTTSEPTFYAKLVSAITRRRMNENKRFVGESSQEFT